jgi:hypothetical protein
MPPRSINRAPRLLTRYPQSAITRHQIGLTLVAGLLAGIAVPEPVDAQATAPRTDGQLVVAQANKPKPPTIALAPVILAEPGTETLLALEVGPADDLPRNTFVRVRGLPPRMSLSDGHAISPGTWAVPLFAIANLRAIIPPGMEGSTDLTVSLVDIDGGVVAEARSALIFKAATSVAQAPPTEVTQPTLRTGALPTAPVASPPMPVTAPPAAPVPALVASAIPVPVPPPAPVAKAIPEPKAETPIAALPMLKEETGAQTPRLEVVAVPKAQPTVPMLSPEASAQAQRLVALGKKQLADGDISAARNYYSRAAESGHAEGALRLAETYDPLVLASLKVRGVQPNLAEARAWYEKARALGAVEAEAPIKRLTAR